MASYSWTATAGGDWNTAKNWVPATVPGAADTALFATGGNLYQVTGDASAACITLDGDNVTFEGQILVGTAGLVAENGAYLAIGSNAFIDDSGSLSVDAASFAEVNGVLITGSSTVGTAEVSGFNASWTDAGTVAASQLYVNSGGSFAGNVALADGGSVTLDTSATFGGGTVALAGGGTIYLANAAGTASGSYGLADAITTGPASAALVLASDAGATLDVSGAISGAGFVYVSGGDVSLAAGNSYAGPTVVDAATLTLNGVGAAGASTVFLQNGATLNTLADSNGAAGSETVVSGGADTVNAMAGSLLVYGSATSLNFQGGTGTSTVVGGAGAVTATGGSGGDTIFGGTSGKDALTTGTGPTLLVGGNGGVLTAIGSANDVLVANAGNTTLVGANATGHDQYFSEGSGNTMIVAGTGNSLVVADGAANTVVGSSGMQTVFLGAGVNQLDFTPGLGGGTSDVIGFGGQDSIRLIDYAASDVQNALANALVTGGSTILTLSDHTQIVLFGFTGLGAGNFSG